MEKIDGKSKDIVESNIAKLKELFPDIFTEGKIDLEALLEDETIWINQKQIVELYGKSKSTISEYTSNIFEEDELNKESVVRKFRTTEDCKHQNKLSQLCRLSNNGRTKWQS